MPRSRWKAGTDQGSGVACGDEGAQPSAPDANIVVKKIDPATSTALF